MRGAERRFSIKSRGEPTGPNHVPDRSWRRPVHDTVVLPGGISGIPSRLLVTPESTAAALVAARAVYERQYRSLGLDSTTITTRLRVFDQGRVRIMLGLFPADGEPIDLNSTNVAIRILRNAAEIWEGLENT